jgi:molybdate transport system substrate-binding protein
MRGSLDRAARGWSAAIAGLVLVLAAPIAGPAAAPGRDVLVFAAASLKNALDDANAEYQKQTGRKVVVSYAASPTLAKQIEAAAPADVFISADLDWMDYLARRKLIKPETRANFLGNRLVLISPLGAQRDVTVAPGFPLAALLGQGRLAMADPDAVPAGKYGKAALEHLGVWSAVQARLARTDNVRAALALVSRGEAPLGVVYQTDAAADPKVKIVGFFGEDTHPPITYPMAALAASTAPAAPAYLQFLRSPAARPCFEKQGFTVLK